MNAKLIKGLSPEALKELEAQYKNAAPLLAKLSAALDKEVKARYNNLVAQEIYQSPNALAELADHRGYIRGVQFALSLLTPKESND